jgi:ribosomal protein S18 acetylase RimI-like enzyme
MPTIIEPAAALDEGLTAGYTGPMSILLREFSMHDYEAAYTLWSASEGIGLSDADRRENIERFLSHNPGLSAVAVEDGALVGALLCGTDGRRGYLHHLAVAGGRRRKGVGRALVDRCLGALGGAGVRKCHIFVIADNLEGKRFWQRIGWEERTTLLVMSRDVVPRIEA